MAKSFSRLEPDLADFVRAQRVFFVATAPLAGDGSINTSPKGHDTLRVLDAEAVAYLDYPGSGVETIAHLRENGRIVLTFCAFEGPPNIVRIHGRGRVVEPEDEEFAGLVAGYTVTGFPRAIIVVHVARVSTSCGFGVPFFEYRGERDQMERWAKKKGAEGAAEYQRRKNGESVDGLPALRWVKP